MRVGEGVARGVARRVSAFGSFGGLTPTKPQFLYFRSVAVPDTRKKRMVGANQNPPTTSMYEEFTVCCCRMSWRNKRWKRSTCDCD